MRACVRACVYNEAFALLIMQLVCSRVGHYFNISILLKSKCNFYAFYFMLYEIIYYIPGNYYLFLSVIIFNYACTYLLI